MMLKTLSRASIPVLLIAALAACGDGPGSAVLNVTIVEEQVTVAVGASIALAWSIEVRGGASDEVSWHSEDEDVVVVDAFGVLRGVSVGNALVTVTSVADRAKYDVVNVTVTEAPSVASVTIDQGDQELGVAEEFAFTATVETTGDASSEVVWTSDDDGVASVGSQGTVTGVSPGTTVIRATSVFDVDRSATVTVTVVSAKALWTIQFGSAFDDIANDAAVDQAGDVVVVGRTGRLLETGAPARTSAADGTTVSDGFARKYDGQGALLWETRFSSDGSDAAWGVAVDASGNVAVVGYTGLLRAGDTITGAEDAFVRVLDPDGNERWSDLIDTGERDTAYAAAFDATGNVIVAGATLGDLAAANRGRTDAYVRKYDPDGTPLWTKQFGTMRDDEAFDLAVDASGRVAVVGYTAGNLLPDVSSGAYDAFVRLLDADGNELWTRQLEAQAYGLAYRVEFDDQGSVVVAGFIGGDTVSGAARLAMPVERLQAPNDTVEALDALVWVLDQDGQERWRDVFEGDHRSIAYAVAVDADQHVVIAGMIQGGGLASDGTSWDALVRKLDSDGNQSWLRRIEASDFDAANGVAVDATGNVFVAGHTRGDLARSGAGGFDVFVRKYSP